MNYFEKRLSELSLSRDLLKKNLQNTWNSSDEYLINYSHDKIQDNSKVLILNDDSTVLSRCVAHASKTVVTDFVDSHTVLNEMHETVLTPIEWFNTQESFDVVLIKIPKSLELFQAQLTKLKECVHPKTVILSSGMIKHISNNTADILNDLMGKSVVNKVLKKAILFSSSAENLSESKSTSDSYILKTKEGIETFPGVFSAGSIDVGTKLLIDAIPRKIAGSVLDLGCGYGVVCQEILKINNECTVEGMDISFSALESTKRNNPTVEVFSASSIPKDKSESYDYVLSNPPFHVGNALDVPLALSLFKGVKRALKPGGVFIFVANNGLNYEPFIKKLFKSIRTIGQSKKYDVFMCTKKE